MSANKKSLNSQTYHHSRKSITFMLTYGDHMSNDVMGDEEDSMKSRLGMSADCTDGLTSHETIQDIFINNIKLVMDQFSEPLLLM
jgi:cobalamin biosynthesis Co2+ chelatase CbiK